MKRIYKKISEHILRNPLKTVTAGALAFLTGGLSAHSQGTFQNLDFESANVPFVPADQFGANVTVSNGVPGWVVHIGTSQRSTMGHNDVSGGGAAVIILGPAWPPSSSDYIIAGNYTVSLEPSTAGPPIATAIGQTAQIPANAQSMSFLGGAAAMFGLIDVTFAGQPLTKVTLGTGPNYTVFGADVSSLAGRTGELRFLGGGLIDNISFSSQPIPEPGSAVLLTAGVLAFAAMRRQHPVPDRKH